MARSLPTLQQLSLLSEIESLQQRLLQGHAELLRQFEALRRRGSGTAQEQQQRRRGWEHRRQAEEFTWPLPRIRRLERRAVARAGQSEGGNMSSWLTSELRDIGRRAIPPARPGAALPRQLGLLMLIGVQKSGSTSLLATLEQHACVQSVRRTQIEVQYWDKCLFMGSGVAQRCTARHYLETMADGLQEMAELERYRRHGAAVAAAGRRDASGAALLLGALGQRSERCGRALLIDKTPSYLPCPGVPALLRLRVPHAVELRLLLVLRHPAERTYSNFLMFENQTFHAADNFSAAVDSRLHLIETWLRRRGVGGGGGVGSGSGGGGSSGGGGGSGGGSGGGGGGGSDEAARLELNSTEYARVWRDVGRALWERAPRNGRWRTVAGRTREMWLHRGAVVLKSIYLWQLQQWLPHFGCEPLFIADAAATWAKPHEHLRALHAWAGLPAALPVSGAISMQRRGTNLHAQHGEMPADVRGRLGAFFAPFNRALQQLLRSGCVDHLGTEFAWIDGWR